MRENGETYKQSYTKSPGPRTCDQFLVCISHSVQVSCYSCLNWQRQPERRPCPLPQWKLYTWGVVAPHHPSQASMSVGLKPCLSPQWRLHAQDAPVLPTTRKTSHSQGFSSVCHSGKVRVSIQPLAPHDVPWGQHATQVKEEHQPTRNLHEVVPPTCVCNDNSACLTLPLLGQGHSVYQSYFGQCMACWWPRRVGKQSWWKWNSEGPGLESDAPNAIMTQGNNTVML